MQGTIVKIVATEGQHVSDGDIESWCLEG